MQDARGSFKDFHYIFCIQNIEGHFLYQKQFFSLFYCVCVIVSRTHDKFKKLLFLLNKISTTTDDAQNKKVLLYFPCVIFKKLLSLASA